MSIQAVRPYFRSRLDLQGFKEWKDGFHVDNIPLNILDKSYHIELGNVSGKKQGQTAIQIDAKVTVKLFVKGFRDVASGIDTAIKYCEGVIQDICSYKNIKAGIAPNNIPGGNLLHVDFKNLDIKKLTAKNDHSILAQMDFESSIILDVL